MINVSEKTLLNWRRGTVPNETSFVRMIHGLRANTKLPKSTYDLLERTYESITRFVRVIDVNAVRDEFAKVDLEKQPKAPPPAPTQTGPGPTFAPTPSGLDIQPKPISEAARSNAAQVVLHQQLLRRTDDLKASLPRISNTHAALAQEFTDYCAFLAADLADLNVASLWCVGTGLSAHIAALRQAGPGVMTPELEPDIVARLETITATHMAFILGFPEGAELQDRVLRAREAAQTNPDLPAQAQAVLNPMESEPNLLASKVRQIVNSILRGFATTQTVAADVLAAGTDIARSGVVACMRILHPILLVNEAVSLSMVFAGYENANVLHAAMSFLHENPHAIGALFANDQQIANWLGWGIRRLRDLAE